MEQTIRCLTPGDVQKKLARRKSWLWAKLKSDPGFPKPFYLGTRPVFLEHELDAWIARRAQGR